jgi:hypothetical protein
MYSNTYAVINADNGQYAVTKNGRTIIVSLTRKPMTFTTIEAALAFVTINQNADTRHNLRDMMPYGK